MKRICTYLLPLVCSLCTLPFLASGRPIKDTTSTETLQAITKFVTSTTDNTTKVLSKIGYNPDDKQTRFWRKYTSVKKIDIAYRAAQQRGNGEKFMLLMYATCSKQYASVAVEPTVAYLSAKAQPKRKKVKFSKKNSADFSPIVMDVATKKAILTFAKYIDRNALGGLQGTLKNYFNCSDESTYELLVNNNSSDVLAKAENNTGYKSNISGVITDLGNVYASVSSNEVLNRQYTHGKMVVMPKGTRTTNKQAILSAASLYKQYIKNDTDATAQQFGKMIANPEKWGGVILGNTVRADASLKTKPEYIVWIPNETKTLEMASGRLEIKFHDNEEPLITHDVYLEDVYAAYEILFADDTIIPHMRIGNGVGLINAHSGNDDIHHLDIHPAIANLELGRSLARVDVWLRIANGLKTVLKNNPVQYLDKKSVDSLVTIGSKYGWKFNDAPMLIKNNNGFLDVKLDGDDSLRENYPMCFSYIHKSKNYHPYNHVTPMLTEVFYDFKRFNDFIKLFAVMRWAKEQNATFLNEPDMPQLVMAPSVIAAYENATSMEAN